MTESGTQALNDIPGPANAQTTRAQEHFDSLNAKVVAMRAVLVQLLEEVVVADNRLSRSQADQLLEANQQLVISAISAQIDAETATGALDEASRVGGLDALTGLPNRNLLLDRFETAISNAKRHGNRVALLFLDLDGFKRINDSLGHASGDHALQLVANCLSSSVRETDTVSRHGGDEFLVLLAEVAHADDAARVAEKVTAALAACGRLDQPPMDLRASIGIGVYPEDGADAKTLIACADAAMYRAKQQANGGSEVQRPGPSGQANGPTAPTEPPSRTIAPFEVTTPDQDRHDNHLREANENLVLAALGAGELLAAAEQMRRRHSELLALIEAELSDPFAPIRLAASTLGIPGAEATSLPRVQAVIEEQAERMALMVRQVLEQHPPSGKVSASGN